MGHIRARSARRDAPPATIFPPPGHNHAACMTDVLARAEAAFESKRRKFTSLRRAVLNEIAASHHAIGAYDVIGRLEARGKVLSPISVYRALEALIAAGMVHRLESRNAYFVCRAPHGTTAENIVFACVDCGTIAESDGGTIFAAIESLAEQHGFAVTSRIAEVEGHCSHCTEHFPAEVGTGSAQKMRSTQRI